MQGEFHVGRFKQHARSIRRGNLDDKADEFTKSGCGIGWGKLASLEELLDDGNLFQMILLRLSYNAV